MGHRDHHHTRDRSTTPLSRWWSRAVAACVAVLWTQGVSVAQLQTAPPPRLTLDELVKEYRQLGLPFPPPDANLVRLKRSNVAPREPEYIVGFRRPPATPGGKAYQLIGGGLWADHYFLPRSVELIRPDARWIADRDGLDLSETEYLCLAIQCKARGWDEFAAAAYAHASEIASYQPGRSGDPAAEAVESLRYFAWERDESRLMERDSDRKEILQRFKAIVKQQPAFATPERLDLIRRLELTVAPRTSKPGTVEALVDGLTEHRFVEYDRPASEQNDEAYWKLVGLGFDAVPVLIRYLADERLTRTYGVGAMGLLGALPPPRLNVGDVVGQILFGLSDQAIRYSWADPAASGQLKPDDVRAWWAEAQKVGEEQWLLDRALRGWWVKSPNLIWDHPEKGIHHVNEYLLRILAAKYPSKFTDVYRTILRERPATWVKPCVRAILAGKFSHAQKVTLLVEGAIRSDFDRRATALAGLAQIDRAAFRTYILSTLRQLRELEVAAFSDEFVLAIVTARDEEVWAGVEAAITHPANVELRTNILGFGSTPDRQPDPFWEARLRLLVALLDLRDHAWIGHDAGEFRDVAASKLAGLLGFSRSSLQIDYLPPDDPHLGTLSRLFMREIVRHAAKRELSRMAR